MLWIIVFPLLWLYLMRISVVGHDVFDMIEPVQEEFPSCTEPKGVMSLILF